MRGIMCRLCFPGAGPLMQIKWRRAQLTAMRNGLPPVGLIHLNSHRKVSDHDRQLQ